jgi:hypothetical protein
MRLPHQAAAAQKNSMGVSGVWMMQPAGNSSVTLNASRTSQESSRRAGKRVLAVSKRKKRAAAERRKPPRRTKSSELPPSAVKKAITQATMGGWSE